ncbi:MAG TPA: ABC transporter permease [Syntrophobacter fumaroxidans]|nr:ABC transporter permease [Syntrophobacter fumaroxidans]
MAFAQRIGLLLFLLATAGFFSVASPHFFSFRNVFNIFVQSSPTLLAAVGMTVVIATAGIDLSVGSIMALSGILAALAMQANPTGIEGIAVSLLSGTAMGLVNGGGIIGLRVSPFIVTLGTAGIYRALALIFTEARPIYGMPLEFRYLGVGHWGPVPVSIFVSLAAVLAGGLVMSRTSLGTNARAIGDNPETARRMGVPIRTTILVVYGLSGAAAALAGMVVTARLNTAEAIAGLGIELEAIAAVVMGGTSFFGGEAKMGGTLLGALIIGTLANGLTLLNVPSYYQQLVAGLVFVMAVTADRFRRGHC